MSVLPYFFQLPAIVADYVVYGYRRGIGVSMIISLALRTLTCLDS